MQKTFLCFVHVERAGGTTMHKMLQNSMPTYLSLKSWVGLSDRRNILSKEKVRFLLKILPHTPGIGGHTVAAFLGYEDVVRDRSIFYFTFLREPISRYMSHFNYQRLVMGINWSPDAFFADPRFSNYQTKKIAGQPDLEKAKKILNQNFGFVGLTEYFDESLVILKRSLEEKIQLDIHYERLNDLREMIGLVDLTTLSSEAQERVYYNNSVDIQLYEYVRAELYPRFKDHYGEGLNADIEQFLRSNASYRYPKAKMLAIKSYTAAIRLLVEPVMHRLA